MHTPVDTFPLRGLVELILAGRPWQVHDDEFWCHVAPPDNPPRLQGWKLHVSATMVSAPLVLQRAAQVLVEQECAFKFARTLGRVSQITSKQSDRPQAGKVIAAYPRDDDHLRELARLLDEATAGLPGPTIMSDRPYRPGSLVHYRYGAFAGTRVLTNDGSFEVRLEAPDGTLVEDVRQPWFCPPSWAELPFDGQPGRAAARPREPKSVLLADRFEVRGSITSSARGGVYRALDTSTGQNVIIKRARPHISGLVWQGDAREGLRREFRLLQELEGIAAQPLTTFEKDDNLFTVLEEVPGRSLLVWVRERWLQRLTEEGEEGLPVDEVLSMAGKLADLLDEVHTRGLVYRDFTANNIMITDDQQVRLIDAEMAARQDEWVLPAQTPGFGAPEVVAQRAIAPAPPPSSDWFSLGAVLCYLATGVAPAFVPDTEPARSACERIELLLRYVGTRNTTAAAMAPAVSGLTRPDPQERWSTADLRQWLSDRATGSGPSGSVSPGSAPDPDRSTARLESTVQERMLHDGLAYLVDNLALTGNRLFPTGDNGQASDACNVQYGAAGVLAVLTRAAALEGAAGGDAPVSLRDAVTRVARWIDQRLTSAPKLLPGLYFGRTGTAWALYDAAGHLQDDALAQRALMLARALPVRWPNPDVCHGAAGAGFTSLHLWHVTGGAEWRQRVEDCVDGVLEAAKTTADGRLHWPVPEWFDSKLAGVNHYGFAHGVAGVGSFLLAAGTAVGHDDAVKAACRAGDTLVAAAIREHGGAYWPNSVSGAQAEDDLRYHWCSGASGVGTFLVRLWRATGEPAYLDLAHEAAVMVHRGRWTSGAAACHGLAGNGEFLLDMADAAAGDYRAWAEELAGCLHARHAVRDGRMVVPDELNAAANLSYNTGLAGVVGFLLRLRYGGPRWWMADTAWLGDADGSTGHLGDPRPGA